MRVSNIMLLSWLNLPSGQITFPANGHWLASSPFPQLQKVFMCLFTVLAGSGINVHLQKGFKDEER